MIVTAEISYYPLSDDYVKPVNDFIEQLADDTISVKTGSMSSLISGDYFVLMDRLTFVMGELMKKYPSVFNIKLSNACPVEQK
jgi:uncharacterized protein YqgV (UPF0045/DUF77 family)